MSGTDPIAGPDMPLTDPWQEAMMALALMAVDPVAVGGVVVRARAGAVRDAFVEALKRLIGPGRPIRRLPANITDDRLLGGLDLAATLRAGRPIADRGLLVEADSGVVLAAMAERMTTGTAARIASVIDRGEVALERDGLTLVTPARFGLVMFDEGVEPDERAPDVLAERLAFHLDLDGLGLSDLSEPDIDLVSLDRAHVLIPHVTVPDAIIDAACSVAVVLGIASLRAPMLVLKVAAAAAALEGRTEVEGCDLTVAVRYVYASRATRLPAPADDAEEPPPPPPDPADAPDNRPDEEIERDRPLEDIVLDAAAAAIPEGLLERIRLAEANRQMMRQPGRSGEVKISLKRGRPLGARAGKLGGGARIDLLGTLRSAAPWQRLRAKVDPDKPTPSGERGRVEVRADDVRIRRFKHQTETTSIFVVDASGSAALARLAEAKGAVELLLAEGYVRRDQAALIAFRGQTADLLLPPTRSLVRAKKSLAGLPGGGGTPLASGIDAAAQLAGDVRRRGQTPVIVFLTDGKANVARDGSQGRAAAAEDAKASARRLRVEGFASLLIDTSPRPTPQAREIAAEMDAVYLPLPAGQAGAVSRAVKALGLGGAP
jgi:magnesium chelatase subunit D